MSCKKEEIIPIKAKKYRILAIDDEEVNLIILKNYLENIDYEVVIELSGKNGLKIMKEDKSIDLVLLDIMLPDISGFDICREIRKERSMVELPILFLTAKVDSKSITEGFESGGNDYLTKPFEKSELLSRVKTLITLKYATESAILSGINYEIANQKRISAEEQKDFGNLLHENLDMEEIFEKIYDKIEEKIDLENIYILFKDEEKYIKTYSKNENTIFEDITEKSDVIYKILENRAAFIANNIVLNIKYRTDNMFYVFPMMSFKNVFGMIILEYNRGIDIVNREIEKFVEQGINAIENAKLLKSIEEKSIELHKKNLLLGKNINRLKSIEKFASILYSYNDSEIVIKSLVFLILSEIGVNIKKGGFFIYKSDEKIFELNVLYETEKVQFLEGVFREKYITKIDEFIKEISKAENKLSDTKINISSSILKRIGESRSLYIDRSERDIQLKNLMTLLKSSKGYLFLASEKEISFGLLFVEVSNELEEEERKLITYLLEVLAIFIKKQLLEKERVELDVIKEMRCTGCNRKLLTYKGKIDFVETKCTKCNTMNKIANPKD